MPTKPKIVTLTNSSVDILNAIRNSATTNYRDYVPYATPKADSIREIGAILMDYPALQNEFLNALINRIGRVMITSKMYSNPLSIFKKGMLEYGETTEEIFVNIAKPFQFDPDNASTTLYAREIPDVRSAFHVMNYQKFYPITIQIEQLRQAFLSWQGITDLITKIINSMYAAASYDEFQVMKYLLAKKILKGELYPFETPAVTITEASLATTVIKAASNNFEFMSNKFNSAGVQTYTPKTEQYLITSAAFDSINDVFVLASAFNMDKVEFMGHKIMIDGFGHLDIARLNELFKDDPTYTEISQDELSALDSIPAILVDKNWFMIFDNLYNFTEAYNGKGLYWNYFYHVWKTFSVSPFANAGMFIEAEPKVTSVTVSPYEITSAAGQSISLTATVQTTHFAPQAVDWQSNTEGVTVNKSGIVTIDSTVAKGTSIIITATSTYDSTKSGACTITIA